MLGLKKKKKLAEKDINAMHDLFGLVRDGKIPYSELEPLVDKYSGLIEAEIKRQEEEERQYHIRCMKNALENRKNDVETLKKKIDDINKKIAEMKAEREDISKQGYGRDEDHLRNLCWWIYNNENEAVRLEGELKTKEDQVTVAEKELLLKQVFKADGE